MQMNLKKKLPDFYKYKWSNKIGSNSKKWLKKKLALIDV